MATAEATRELYPTNDLSGRKLFALIDQHNAGVIDDHVIAAKLDGDSGVTDADYEDGLTAKEIQYAGYTPTETAVRGPAGDFTVGFVTEGLAKALLDQHKARVADIEALAAKLNEDAGVTGVAFTSTAGTVYALGVAPASGGDPSLYVGAGGGLDAKILQGLTDQINMLVQDWHGLCAALDADATVNLADYEDSLTALTLTEY